MPHWVKYAVFTPPLAAVAAAAWGVSELAMETPAAVIRAVAATVAVAVSMRSRLMGGPPELGRKRSGEI
jgi:hypothetical protein